MQNVREVTQDTFWLGASDRRISLFENTYPVPNGMSYNNYLVRDEKCCLIDGVDASVERQFLENLDYALDGRELDYLVVQHMEPDHCAAIPDILRRWPNARVVGTAKTFDLMKQFFGFDAGEQGIRVKEGDTLKLGAHTLRFIMAPMVHWPEVMVSFDELTGALFSADAFGAFGATGGAIFADEVNWDRDWHDEARRYFVNIVGKYGRQTTALLKKASKLDIKLICPLHAHIWRKDLSHIIDLTATWASWRPEDESVAIFYGSIYNNTALAADILSARLAEAGVHDVRVYDVSRIPVSELVSQAFRSHYLVFATSTYNMGIFDPMQTFMDDLAAHGLSDRIAGLIYNGSWAPAAGKLMAGRLTALKGFEVLEPEVHIASALNEESAAQLDDLAAALIAARSE